MNDNQFGADLLRIIYDGNSKLSKWSLLVLYNFIQKDDEVLISLIPSCDINKFDYTAHQYDHFNYGSYECFDYIKQNFTYTADKNRALLISQSINNIKPFHKCNAVEELSDFGIYDNMIIKDQFEINQ